MVAGDAVWAVAAAYEPYVGRWSRGVATEFVAWLCVPAGGRWLDTGCGTGALTQAILRAAAPAAVVGLDPSAGFLVYAEAQTADPRAQFVVGDALALPDADATYDAAVSGLVLSHVPDAARMVADGARVTRPGGVVAAYVWDYAGRMELMRYFWEAAVELDPAVAALTEGLRFPLCQPEPLRALFAGAGLAEVEVRGIEIPTVFADFDHYWRPFLGGQGPAPAYAMSLDEDQRGVLREALRARLPTAADGTIPLVARAWAVKGRVGVRG